MAYTKDLGQHEEMSLARKIKKFAIYFGCLIVLGPLIWGAWRIKTNPMEQRLPLPFSFSPATIPLLRTWPAENPNERESVQVLFVGDEFAQEIWKWRDTFNQELSRDLSTPFKLGVLASPDQGLHRLAARLKLMDTLPKIVILMSGGAEAKEPTFNLTDYNLIKSNLKLSQNALSSTLIEFFPVLSRLFYRPTKLQDIPPEIIGFKGKLFDYEYQMSSELTYLLFQIQLEDLTRYLQKQKVQVVLSTLPVRLEEAPHGTCLKAQSPELTTITTQIWSMLKEGRNKDASALLEKLNVPQNPSSIGYYLLALSQQKNGDLSSAKDNFKLASAYDCRIWRANHTFNTIIRQVALDHDVPLFDFEQWHNQDFGKNNLFLNATVPQPFYLEKAAFLLGRTLRSYLKL